MCIRDRCTLLCFVLCSCQTVLPANEKAQVEELLRAPKLSGDYGALQTALNLSLIHIYCEDAGFSVVRDFVGHGTGKELHEDPEVPNYGQQGRGPRLVPSVTIAIEPMICQGDYKIKQLNGNGHAGHQTGPAALMAVVGHLGVLVQDVYKRQRASSSLTLKGLVI